MTKALAYDGLVQKYDQYHDYEFSCGPEVLYVITYDEDEDTWFGVRRTAKTPTDDYGDPEDVPEKMVYELVETIPSDKLPPKFLIREHARLYKEVTGLRIACDWYLRELRKQEG